MNPFEYGKSFLDKVFPKIFGTLIQTKPYAPHGIETTIKGSTIFVKVAPKHTSIQYIYKLLDKFIMFNKMIITSYDVMNLFSIQLDWQPAKKEIKKVRDQANSTS